MNRLARLLLPIVFLILLSSCGPSDKLWPSDKIGPIWVNRYGHSKKSKATRSISR